MHSPVGFVIKGDYRGRQASSRLFIIFVRDLRYVSLPDGCMGEQSKSGDQNRSDIIKEKLRHLNGS